MKAARIQELGRVEIDEVDDPLPRPDDVVVDVRCVQPSVTECMLIDGDDVPYADYLAAQLAEGPVAFGGHEFSGVVTELGSAVEGVAVGDRVTAVETASCGTCPACRKRRPDACIAPEVIGFNRPGAFAERIAVPARSLVRLPDAVTFSSAAAIQPMAGAVHAHAQLDVKPGESVLVIGGGVMGLLAVAVARLGNATRVVLATRSERKRQLALEMGADEVIDASQDVAAVADELSEGLGFDVVVETAGGSESAGLAGTSTVFTALRAVRRGGRVSMVSVLGETAELPTGLMRQKAVSLMYPRSGAGYYAATTSVFEHCVALVAAGRVDLERLVTHRLEGIESLPEALTITKEKSRYGAINPAQVSL